MPANAPQPRADQLEEDALFDRLRQHQPLLWNNTRRAPAAAALDRIARQHALARADIEAADALLQRWAPALQRLFPELAASAGVIESPLIAIDNAGAIAGTASAGRTLLKADHALPVAGSIKARGGIYEVLAHAEALAERHGVPGNDGNPLALLGDEARTLFARHTVAVGSTGNLGLSIGVMASALGFDAVVHMSHDAKQWKKERLRERGVDVVEHRGDYAAAVAAGRAAAHATPTAYFVDDENSRNLFLGYAVAALRLKSQLEASQVTVDAEHPLHVHLPCGVGGAPGGITFGLKHVFGDAVHCWFAEPCASPAMLVRLASPRGPLSVYDVGLDNITEADGLAVASASELVHALVGELIAGVYTVADDELFAVLARLRQQTGMRIEPSAAAGILGVKRLGEQRQSTALDDARATQLWWTTGGSFVPAEEYDRFYRRGCALLAATPATAT